MFLVERPRINEEQAVLPRAAVPRYTSEDLSYFSFYSCRLKKSNSFILSPQVNAFHIQMSWVETTIKVTIRKCHWYSLQQNAIQNSPQNIQASVKAGHF